MLKATKLINKPIICFNTGKVCGTVKDLLFDENKNNLIAFLIEESNFFNSATILLFSAVQSIGVDAIITATKENIIPAFNMLDIETTINSDKTIKSMIFMTINGYKIGKIMDFYFDEKTGIIEGYEVSRGLLSDILKGRFFVPISETLKIGEHFAFVSSTVYFLKKDQAQESQLTIFLVRLKIQEICQKMIKKFGFEFSELGYSYEENFQKTTYILNNKSNLETEKIFLLGKVIQKSIFHKDIVFLPIGHIITQKDIEVAQSHGIFEKLFNSIRHDFCQHSKLNEYSEQNTLLDSKSCQNKKIYGTVKQLMNISKEKTVDLKQSHNTSIPISIDEINWISAQPPIKKVMEQPVRQIVKTSNENAIAVLGQVYNF